MLAIHQRLIRHQAAIKNPMLVIAPDLSTDGISLRDCNRVIPATQAVDLRIPAVNRTLTCNVPLLFRSEGGFFTGSPRLMPGLEPPPRPSQGNRVHTLLFEAGESTGRKKLGIFLVVALRLAGITKATTQRSSPAWGLLLQGSLHAVVDSIADMYIKAPRFAEQGLALQ